MKVLRGRLEHDASVGYGDAYGSPHRCGDGYGLGEYGTHWWTERGSGTGQGFGYGGGWRPGHPHRRYRQMRDGSGFGYGTYGSHYHQIITGGGYGSGTYDYCDASWRPVHIAWTPKPAEQKKKIPVLITTDYGRRAVFFGYIDPDDAANENIYAENVQLLTELGDDCRGVLGLASRGPTEDCRVSEPVPAGTIRGVTLVVEVTPEAEAAWHRQRGGTNHASTEE